MHSGIGIVLSYVYTSASLDLSQKRVHYVKHLYKNLSCTLLKIMIAFGVY